MEEEGGEVGGWSRSRVEEEFFDVFSLDLLQAERQILRYSSDEKVLVAGFLHGFHCNMCGLEYGELTQNDRCLSRSWKQFFINYTFIKAN